MALRNFANKVGQGTGRKGNCGQAYSAVTAGVGVQQELLCELLHWTSFMHVHTAHQVHKGQSTNPLDTCFLHCRLFAFTAGRHAGHKRPS